MCFKSEVKSLQHLKANNATEKTFMWEDIGHSERSRQSNNHWYPNHNNKHLLPFLVQWLKCLLWQPLASVTSNHYDPCNSLSLRVSWLYTSYQHFTSNLNLCSPNCRLLCWKPFPIKPKALKNRSDIKIAHLILPGDEVTMDFQECTEELDRWSALRTSRYRPIRVSLDL